MATLPCSLAFMSRARSSPAGLSLKKKKNGGIAIRHICAPSNLLLLKEIFSIRPDNLKA